jgi:hypothetical protein
MTRHNRIGLVLILALAFGFAGTAQATSFSLGHITGPGAYAIQNNKSPGAFEDRIHFVIDPGIHLVFSAKVHNQSDRHDAIHDLDGALTYHSAIIEDADAREVGSPTGFPYPYYLVTFEKIVLGPGHYVITMFGHTTSDIVGKTSQWAGTVTFSQTPLPGALLLMLTALGAFGLIGRFRRGMSA